MRTLWNCILLFAMFSSYYTAASSYRLSEIKVTCSIPPSKPLCNHANTISLSSLFIYILFQHAMCRSIFFMVEDYMYSMPACDFLHCPGDYYSYWYWLSKPEIFVVLLYLLRWITFNFCFGSAFLKLGLFCVERSDVLSWQIQKT